MLVSTECAAFRSAASTLALVPCRARGATPSSDRDMEGGEVGAQHGSEANPGEARPERIALIQAKRYALKQQAAAYHT